MLQQSLVHLRTAIQADFFQASHQKNQTVNGVTVIECHRMH
jgi:hypothetical protein